MFDWPLRSEFLNRTDELEQLEEWWESGERLAINLHGRRRVGKSWLFRAFCHGKPAVVLVAQEMSTGVQLTRFADVLAEVVGTRPDIPDVPGLFQLLFDLGRKEKILVVIDEFPNLLPWAEAKRRGVLSGIQAVIEDNLHSKLKLILCGSQISQMEEMLAERSPLRGRLRPFSLKALTFDRSEPFLRSHGMDERIIRFAVAGGMPPYLTFFGGENPLKTVVCEKLLDPYGALHNEPREILHRELSHPNVYLSVLEQLAGGDKPIEKIAEPLRMRTHEASKYITTLQNLRLVQRRVPIGSPVRARSGLYRLIDPFFRFWFRFVFPYQVDLESLDLLKFYDELIKPDLADHVSPVFEEICRVYVRKTHGELAQRIGGWWGPAVDSYRREGIRTSEEIDVVGLSRSRVTVVGECKWSRNPVSETILSDVETFKVPDLRQTAKVAQTTKILLFGRTGFTKNLIKSVQGRNDVTLIDLPELERGLHAR